MLLSQLYLENRIDTNRYANLYMRITHTGVDFDHHYFTTTYYYYYNHHMCAITTTTYVLLFSYYCITIFITLPIPSLLSSV